MTPKVFHVFSAETFWRMSWFAVTALLLLPAYAVLAGLIRRGGIVRRSDIRVFAGSAVLAVAVAAALILAKDHEKARVMLGVSLPAMVALLPLIGVAIAFFRKAERATPGLTGFFAMALILHVGLCLLLALMGQNYDLDSWLTAARIVDEGKVVYSHTERYNYGPWWAYILGGCGWVQSRLGLTEMEAFHTLVVAALCGGNLLLATLLARLYHPLAGIVYPLIPVGLLITGYQSQFDNLAIAVGLMSWALLHAGGERSTGRLALSGALLGVSLGMKHILLFFPLCVLICPRVGALRARLGYVASAYAVFLGHFVPFALDAAAREGIRTNVFFYRSIYNASTTAVACLITATPPPGANVSHLIAFAVWVGGVLAVSWVAARRRIEAMPLLYLVAFVALSPCIVDQYLVIPVAACAVYCFRPSSWWYVAGATMALLIAGSNIGTNAVGRWLTVFGTPGIALSAVAVQILLLLWLLSWFRLSTTWDRELFGREQ